MPLSHKALPAITEADLQALVEGQKDWDTGTILMVTSRTYHLIKGGPLPTFRFSGMAVSKQQLSAE